MPQRRVNTRNLVTIISIAILVGTELIGASLAAAYAIGSLFEFSREANYGLLALGGLLGVWALWGFVKTANKVEPVFETTGN
jgi:hypothetical protein